jgi:hypothetical protein
MLYCVQLVKEQDSETGDPKKTGFAADPENPPARTYLCRVRSNQFFWEI